MNLRKLITAALPKGTKYLGEPSTTTKAPLLKQDEISKYEFANGTLPVQGQLGNCWLIAPMLAIQLKDPQYFNARIQLQPDAEIAKVKLNVHGKEKWVKVSLKIPFNADGSPAYAYATKDNSTQSPSGQKSSHATSLWPSLIEKAVAKEISGGYTGISRGFGVFGFNLLGNGKRTIAIPVPSLEKIERLQNAGFAIVTSTHPLSTWLAKRTGTEVPANAHVMAVESVDLKSETITIRNQWNPNVNLVYSRKQFKMLFISIEAMQLKISK